MLNLKYTNYFKYMRLRPDRARIKEEWISEVVNNPLEEQLQDDGRIRRWGWIEEEGKYLRVILLEDGLTIHNAFFDRSFTSRGGNQ